MIATVHMRYEPRDGDIAEVRSILQSHGLFREGEIAVAEELVLDRLGKGRQSEYSFVFAEDNGRVNGFACFGPITVTVSSYDLYWIAVRKGTGRSGLGSRLFNEVVRISREAGATRIFAETSSLPDYDPARRFYLRQGFTQHASVPDFYAPGDHKLILGRSI